jgi:hypothetical protein
MRAFCANDDGRFVNAVRAMGYIKAISVVNKYDRIQEGCDLFGWLLLS